LPRIDRPIKLRCVMGATLVAIAIVGALCALAFRFGGRALRWWRTRDGLARPRYPIVLVHGMMGFDEIKLGRASQEYFRGVRERLESLGLEVHRARLPPVASVAVRARALGDFIRSLKAKRVNVIAHSMGGLDARYAISKLGLGDRIASLVTIGTPHRGTPVADAGGGVLEKVGARWLIERWQPIAGIGDLRTASARAFNDDVRDRAGVFYGCVVARANGKVHPLLVPTHRWLRETSGDNDGLVPHDSQVWGAVLATVEADHWASVGWSDAFDAPRMYEDVVRELRARGL
jgi:triacylglycerol lipase